MSFVYLSNMDNIGETIKTIGEKLIPNLLSFVVQFIAFIILLVAVFFLAYKPVKKIMKKRSDYIENEIKEAKDNNLVAQNSILEAKSLLANSKNEASVIIANAEKKGQEQYDSIIAKANEEIIEMKKQAEKDIEIAKQEALEDIKNEMVSVALSASEEILKREVSEADNKRLAEEFIDRLN